MVRERVKKYFSQAPSAAHKYNSRPLFFRYRAGLYQTHESRGAGQSQFSDCASPSPGLRRFCSSDFPVTHNKALIYLLILSAAVPTLSLSSFSFRLLL